MADTLLLVCPPDDPLGLLADSRGGGRVPFAVWYDDGFGWRAPAGDSWRHRDQPRALVLQLDGVPDEIGVGRLQAVLRRDDLPLVSPWPAWADELAHEQPHLRQLLTLAVVLTHLSPTYRLANLAADGREKES